MRVPDFTNAALAAAAVAVTSVSTLAVSHTVARLRHRRHMHAHACDQDSGNYPTEHLVLHDIDGAATGPCIAALREKYLTENGSIQPLLDAFDYPTLLRSFTETTLVLAMNLADATFQPCGCDDPNCPNQEPDPETHTLVGGQMLLHTAMSFEATHYSHLAHCSTCQSAGPEAKGLVRARFARDIADDLITNAETNHIVLRGVPLQAGFDVVCSLLGTIEGVSEVLIPTQIENLSTGLAMATAHTSGVPFGPGFH